MDEDLILDVSSNYEEFRQRVRPLVGDFKKFAEDTIKTILEFIQYKTDAETNLNNCVDAIEEALGGEQVSERMPEESVEVIKEETFRLAEAIYHQLRDVGAYDPEGFLGFKFKEIIGRDIVLEPVTPEDFGTPSDSGGEEDPYSSEILVEED